MRQTTTAQWKGECWPLLYLAYYLVISFISFICLIEWLRGNYSGRQVCVTWPRLILVGRSHLLALKMMARHSAAGCWQKRQSCTPTRQSEGNLVTTVVAALLLFGKSRILNMQLAGHLTTVTNWIILSEVGFRLKRQHTRFTKTGHLVKLVWVIEKQFFICLSRVFPLKAILKYDIWLTLYSN